LQRTQLMDMLGSLAKNFILQNIMGQQSQQGGGAAPGPGAGAGGGGDAQPPMPSTPLPGT
jgi:hypothetical protein